MPPMNVRATPRKKRGSGRDESEAGAGDVRSVRRALQLLTLFDGVRSRASLSELARESALATSTVQRLLQTLERESFLVREADGRYALGTALMRLGITAVRATPLHERAGPWLTALSRKTGETANLAVLDTPESAFYIRQRVSDQAIRHENWVGRPFAVEGTAVGMALTGRVGGGGGYVTRHTQTPDVSAAAAPVHGAEGDIVAGLSLTGPTFRIDDEALERMRHAVVEAARELSHALGGNWPYEPGAGTARLTPQT